MGLRFGALPQGADQIRFAPVLLQAWRGGALRLSGGFGLADQPRHERDPATAVLNVLLDLQGKDLSSIQLLVEELNYLVLVAADGLDHVLDVLGQGQDRGVAVLDQRLALGVVLGGCGALVGRWRLAAPVGVAQRLGVRGAGLAEAGVELGQRGVGGPDPVVLVPQPIKLWEQAGRAPVGRAS